MTTCFKKIILEVGGTIKGMQTVTREINCIPNIKNNLTEGDGWIGGAGGDVTLSLEMGEISKTTGKRISVP